MDSPREIWSRLRLWLRSDEMEREMDEEMRFHVEKLIERNLRDGMSPGEARRQALVRFGGVERFKEESRRESRPRLLEELLQDLRYGLRALRRNPGFTLVAVLTLGLGIGANAAIFSVVDGVLLRPVPLQNADRLLVVWETDRNTGTTHEPASVPDFVDFRARSRRLEQVGAFQGLELNLVPPEGEPRRLAALAVSHELLPMAGIRPLLGRTFLPADETTGDVALIGESAWETLFARDPRVLGRTLRLDDLPHTIVGVLPDAADFGTLQVLSAADYARAFADRGRAARVEVWVPLATGSQALPRSTHPIFVLGRLAPGATPEQAQQEMTAVMADLEKAYPENTARGAFLEPFPEVVFGPVRPALLVLLGAVALVLLAACANIASLLVARGAVRQREVAVRTVLGAGWRRLVRQFLVESALLTAAGAGLGLALASLTLDVLVALAPGGIPRLSEVGLDGRVLAVMLSVSLLVALAVGLIPAFQARRTDLQATLKEEAGHGSTADRRRSRLRSGLVVAELALAVVLSVGAGLLLKSFWRLQSIDPGFRAEGVVKAEIQLPASRYPRSFSTWPDWPEQNGFHDRLLERVRALPGVESAAMAGNHPLDAGFTNSFFVVGREDEARDWPEISVRRVSPGYFPTLGVPLVRGRLFREGDAAGAPPVLLVNEEAARRFFQGRDPLGQKISFWRTEWTIVGIVSNERFLGLAETPPAAIYAPLAQAPSVNGAGCLLVRSKGDLATLIPEVRGAIRELDPQLAVFGEEPLATTLAESMGQQRFTMLLLAAFAGLALVLAAVGVYGVLSFVVVQRAPEMGIRMALGATQRYVVRQVVWQGARLALVGLALGLAGAFVLTRFLSGLLFGVEATDPLTFLAVPGLVLLAALLASWVPAQRATEADPMSILRAS